METVFLSEIINTGKDIKETIEYMAITSAPGLDGITASIYEKNEDHCVYKVTGRYYSMNCYTSL